MNKIFDKRLYVLWSFIVLINSHFLQAQDFNEPPYFDPYSDSGVSIPQPSYINPSLIPSQILNNLALEILRNTPLSLDASPSSFEALWQDSMPAQTSINNMPVIASNAMPEIMQQMRAQDHAVSQQPIYPWGKYVLTENLTLAYIQHVQMQAPEPSSMDRSLQAQFWQMRTYLYTALNNLSSNIASEKLQGFFALLHAPVPAKHSKLYNQCVSKLVQRFCKKDKASQRFRLTQISLISKQELGEIFKEYLALFPPDWQSLRYFIHEAYVQKCLCNEKNEIQKEYTESFYDTHNSYNTIMLDMAKATTMQCLHAISEHNPYKNDIYIKTIYDALVQEKFSSAHSQKTNQFDITKDPLYVHRTHTVENYELLLLRQEYANAFLNILAPLQEGSAIQTIFVHIPENISELLSALQNPNTYKKALDAVIDSLEQHHPECFLENGVLSIFQKNPYVHYMHHDADVDKELLHIINHALAVQEYKNVPEGIITLAKKTLKLARQATNKDHVNYVNRNILAHTSHEFLLHAQSQDLMLHELTYEVRKHAHGQAHEKQLYVQEFENKYATLRKQAYEKTVQNNYAVTLQKYTITHDTVMLLCKENLSPHEYESFSGTDLQHALMSETTENLDKLAILNACAQKFGQCGSFFQNTVSSLTLLAQAAKEFNDESDLTISMQCLNTLESGIEIVAGSVQSVPLLAQDLAHICEHPIDTAVSIAHFTKDVALVLGQTARYCAFDRYFDPECAQETYKNASIFLTGVSNHIKYSLQESSAQDYARIAAQQYLFLKAPGALLDATSALLQHTKNIPLIISESELIGAFKNNLAKGIEPYTELAFETGEKIKTGIQGSIKTVNAALATEPFIVQTAHQVQSIAQTLKTKWQTIEEILPNLTDVTLKKLLKNEAFIDKVALESTELLQKSYKEYRKYIRSHYPEMIKLIKAKTLPEKYFPNGITEKEIIELLDHIFDIQAKRGRGSNLIKIHGGHVNYKGMLQSCEIFESGPIENCIQGFVKRKVYTNTPLGRCVSYKTYFSQDLEPLEVVNLILEKIGKIKEIKNKTTGEIRYLSEICEGLDLEYKFNNGIWKSVYGAFEKDL